MTSTVFGGTLNLAQSHSNSNNNTLVMSVMLSSWTVCENVNVLCRGVVNCCMRRTCWNFTTRGLCTVGQDEVVVLLECLPDEFVPPPDVFHHIDMLYEQACQGGFWTCSLYSFYRAAWNANAVLRWEFRSSVRLSVCPSVKRVNCAKTAKRYV